MADFSMSPEDEARIASWVKAELLDETQDVGDEIPASAWLPVSACVPCDTSSPAPAVVTDDQVRAAFDLLKDTETLPRHERVSEAFARRIAEAVVGAR